MSVNIDHPKSVITSTSNLTVKTTGGSSSDPRPMIIDADYLRLPVAITPIADFVGGIIMDSTSHRLKYNNGSEWITIPRYEEIVDPINVRIDNVMTILDTKIDKVTYQESSVPIATISGTTLNIVFPSDVGVNVNGVTGLFTSLPPGSITGYSLVSGQNYTSVRAQIGNQTGRNGTEANPYVTSTGWVLADGKFWSWTSNNGTKVIQVPNLNTNSYLKGVGEGGITKIDSVIPYTGGKTGGTAIRVEQMPPHEHLTPGVHGGDGDYAGQYLNGTGAPSKSVTGVELETGVLSSKTTSSGGGEQHDHTIPEIEPNHFNIVWLYNIAEPELAISETTADFRYVFRAGDEMTGDLKLNTSGTPATERSAVSYKFLTDSLAKKLNLSGGTITGQVFAPTPVSTSTKQIANVEYVNAKIDAIDLTPYFLKTGGPVSGFITHQIEPAGVVNDYYLVNKKYVNTYASGYLPLVGGTLTGDLKLYNTGVPNTLNSAVSYKYLSDSLATKLNLSGGTITGQVFAPTPVSTSTKQLANVEYVNSKLTGTIMLDHIKATSVTATTMGTTNMAVDNVCVLSYNNQERYGSMNVYDIARTYGISGIKLATKTPVNNYANYTVTKYTNNGTSNTFQFINGVYPYDYAGGTTNRYKTRYIYPTIVYMLSHPTYDMYDTDLYITLYFYNAAAPGSPLKAINLPAYSRDGSNGVNPGNGLTSVVDGIIVTCSYFSSTVPVTNNGGCGSDNRPSTTSIGGYKLVIQLNGTVPYTGNHGMLMTAVISHINNKSAGNLTHEFICYANVDNAITPTSHYG